MLPQPIVQLTDNGARFRDTYERHLLAAIEANPGDYLDTVASAKATNLAERMTFAIAKGSASLSDTMKAAARELGISPCMRDIRAFVVAKVQP